MTSKKTLRNNGCNKKRKQHGMADRAHYQQHRKE